MLRAYAGRTNRSVAGRLAQYMFEGAVNVALLIHNFFAIFMNMALMIHAFLLFLFSAM